MIFNFPSQTAEKLATDIELVKRTGANQVTFYPLMASPAVRESLKRTVGKVDYAREYRYYQQISEQMSDTFEPASAWTFSRTGGGMIDEYIVDYEDYVGLGSGAFSLPRRRAVREHVLAAGLRRAHCGGQDAGAAEARLHHARPHALPLPDVALRDAAWTSASSRRDFGVTIDLGLAVEMAFMRSAGAFAIDNADELVLSATGRYLLVAMMREFFVGVNNLRDQAREALSTPERELLFGDGDASLLRPSDDAARLRR